MFGYFAVPLAAFRVVPPSPFVEIAHHVHAVGQHQAETVVASLLMGMHNGHIRVKHGEPMPVHSSCYVYILGIEEESRVETACFLKARSPEEDETALVIRHIQWRPVVPG